MYGERGGKKETDRETEGHAIISTLTEKNHECKIRLKYANKLCMKCSHNPVTIQHSVEKAAGTFLMFLCKIRRAFEIHFFIKGFSKRFSADS